MSQPGPEEQRLIDRLFNDPTRKTVNFHVSWGPDAHRITREERAAAINHALDATERGEGKPLDFADSVR
jgi:hypothetical protein